MLRNIVGWVDEQLAGGKPSAALRLIVASSVSVATFGLFTGNEAVQAGVLGVFAGFGAVLLADRRSLRHRYETHQRLTQHYCDFIYSKMQISPQIISWQQITRIDSAGNARETIVVRARTLVDDIQFFRLRFGPGWNQPQRYRRGIRVNVRGLSVEGTPGTRLTITKDWLDTGKLDLTAHFHAPPRAGSEILLTMDWDWPGKCIPLLRRNPDLFVFEFGKSVGYAIQTVVLPAGYDAYYEPVGFSHDQIGYSLVRSEDDRGQVQFIFEAQLLPEDHRAGMRLELRGRGHLAA